MNDKSIITFGLHKGKDLQDVPAKYLLWLETQSWVDLKLKAYIIDNRQVLEKEIEESYN